MKISTAIILGIISILLVSFAGMGISEYIDLFIKQKELKINTESYFIGAFIAGIFLYTFGLIVKKTKNSEKNN